MKNIRIVLLILLGWVHGLNAQFSYKTEKVFLQTDRERYYPGDTVWFKSTLLNASNHHFSAESAVGYLQLINSNSVINQELKLAYKNAQSSAFLVLPKTYLPGEYYLVNFTNLMKNHNSNFYYKKKIILLKRVPTPPPPVNAKPLPNSNELPVLSIFPEGGNLVNGIESKVGFMIKTPKKIKQGFEIKILDSDNKYVNSFYPDAFGMGNFFFKPEFGKKYKTEYTYENKKYEGVFPVAQDFGYVLSADNIIFSDGILINVHSNINVPENLKIRASLRGEILLEYLFETQNSVYKFALKEESIPSEGVVHIQLINQDNSVIAERVVYHPKNNIFTVKPSKLKAAPLPRAKVDVSFEVFNQDGQPLKNAFLTVSVIDGGLQKSNKFSSMEKYAQLHSDFEELGFAADTLFSFGPTISKFYLDNLMLTKKWDRKNIDNTIKVEKNLFMEGTAIDSSGVMANLPIHIYSKDNFLFSYSKVTTDAEGKFRIPGYWTDSVALIIKDDFGKKVNIKFDSVSVSTGLELAFSPVVSTTPIPKTASAVSATKPPLKTNAIALKEVVIKGSKTLDFSNDYQRKLYDWNSDFSIEVDSTDESLLDYLASKSDYFKRDFRSADAASNDLYFMINGKKANTAYFHFYSKQDLVLIDLVVDKEKLKKANVTEKIIVNFLTKKGRDLESIFTQEKQISWMGYASDKAFNVSKFKPKAPNNLQDRRQTLYWNPNIKTDATGKATFSFYNSDLAKRFLISINGTDGRGNLVSYSELLK